VYAYSHWATTIHRVTLRQHNDDVSTHVTNDLSPTAGHQDAASGRKAEGSGRRRRGGVRDATWRVSNPRYVLFHLFLHILIIFLKKTSYICTERRQTATTTAHRPNDSINCRSGHKPLRTTSRHHQHPSPRHHRQRQRHTTTMTRQNVSTPAWRIQPPPPSPCQATTTNGPERCVWHIVRAPSR